MSWITKERADEYLSLDETWNDLAITKKEYLLEQSSNRLEQLTFKNEDENRVGDRYIDGESTVKVASKNDYLIDAQAGNWDYQASIGWQRDRDQDLVIYNKEAAFLNNDNDGLAYNIWQYLTFKEIQSLQSFGGEFGGTIALDPTDGQLGCFTAIETQQATGIVDSDGEQVFAGGRDRRLNASFGHNNVYCRLFAIEGTAQVWFNGTDTVDVIDEQGNEQTNTVPLIVPGEYFTYKFIINDGLDKTMYLYVNDVLVGNPEFGVNNGGKDNNRLLYSSGASGGVDRISYLRTFGSTINVENPTTIPLRLVAACALLALEYGKFPLNYTGDKEYLENENDYHRMQDLPINVQAAVEPFLADYRETENVINPDEVDRERTYHATALEYK